MERTEDMKTKPEDRQTGANERAAAKSAAMQRKSSAKTRILAGTAMLAAVSCILQYLEIVVPFMPFFIKFDFSDLPALLGSFAYGPLSGVAIELIKNLIHCAVSQSATVGELANFLMGSAFVVTASLIYKAHKTKKRALIGGLCGSVAMGLFSVPANYFVVYPFYYKAYMPEEVVLAAYQELLPAMTSVFQSILVFNLPFTIVKGLISTAVAMLIYKPLSPILKGQ